MTKAQGKIRVGIGGWTFEPWRGSFFPDDLVQKRELEYASSKFSSIEVNGTYYGSQKPATFQSWHDEAPDDFVFALKGPRFATNRKVLAEAGPSVERFLNSGITRLGDKLGPLNWQFMATKKFDPEDFAAFLSLLPKEIEGRQLRHAVEVRHDSFACAEFVDLVRSHEVGIVVSADGDFPQIADITTDFVYARILGTVEDEPLGYPPKALDEWAGRAKVWAAGDVPKGLATFAKPAKPAPREVFLYVISGYKQRNPQAAMGIMERL
ncbi:DUF72 domain-containing protein [Cypionkella sp.]|uniref:DUF72 domain-containing protein n=1 Tax=Cypionkella sp. TaxID=2811411 RepID=UPI00260D7D6B|nr:DUF72 domain-containing protein [Cypionkella sp.]MDB5664567.1 hypothetical protein [Cypionkella sp.]